MGLSETVYRERYYIFYALVVLALTWISAYRILENNGGIDVIGNYIQREYDPEENISEILKRYDDTHERTRNVTRINSLGFKDDEWMLEKPDGMYRIIALGDSMTYGFDVGTDDTWPSQLERKLNSSGHNVDVMNMGGWTFDVGTVEELVIFKNMGLDYEPDMLILQYYNNDWRSLDVKDNAQEKWHRYNQGEYELPEDISKIINETNASEKAISGLIYDMELDAYWMSVEMEDEWNVWVKPPLLEMIELADENDIEMIVVTWDSVDEQMELLEPILDEHDIPLYDFSGQLQSIPSLSNTRLPDEHLNRNGYHIVSDNLVDILENGYLG